MIGMRTREAYENLWSTYPEVFSGAVDFDFHEWAAENPQRFWELEAALEQIQTLPGLAH